MKPKNKINLQNFLGRQWVRTNITHFKNDSRFEIRPAMMEIDHEYYCARCRTKARFTLPDGKVYCRGCINLGRICQNDYLISYSPKQVVPEIITTSKVRLLNWTGKLTPVQEVISEDLVLALKSKRNYLVHAVTGAGKTEMLFATLEVALQSDFRVCLATPRIDVVNELYPRLQAVFPTIDIGKYHGQNYCPPANNRLIVCTTHQLLKFYHAFDLIIIDEVDAFPYRNNPVLSYGSSQALKLSGQIFYLTATPSEEQLDLVQQDKLGYSQLKQRFHGGKLPIPELKFLILPLLLRNSKLNYCFKRELDQLIEMHKPILIFVPRINELKYYQQILVRLYPNLVIESVYAADSRRLKKVEAFRDGGIDLLLATTILERGVTIKHVQVIVLDADDQIYQKAALIQIAGRVGRDATDSSGKVLFFYHTYTEEIDNAIKEIKELNRG